MITLKNRKKISVIMGNFRWERKGDLDLKNSNTRITEVGFLNDSQGPLQEVFKRN